jgi:hypothetical protein
LDAAEPSDEQSGEEIIKRGPSRNDLWLVDGCQCEGNPVAEAVAAMQQLAEEGIPFLHPFPQPFEQLGFGDGEGDGAVMKER